MGFPNVDKILIRLFKAEFAAIKLDPAFIITDTFTDLDESEQNSILQYLVRKTFTDELRDRGDAKVYLTTSFPMLDMPLPQISITLGQEDTDRYMGDQVGTSTPVLDTDGNTIAWDVLKGFYARSNWSIAVVAATKDETIWLSRLCERIIFDNMNTLELEGVAEVSLTMADHRLDPQHQPMTASNRTIRMTALTMNSYRKRIPASVYATGNNTAL